MSKRWRKLGPVFSLRKDGAHWMISRAMSPAPLLLPDRIRVYFSSIAGSGVSLIGFAEFDRAEPTRLLEVSEEPLLECGAPGLFDDSGTIANSAVHHSGQVWLYYTGYNRRVLVPWSNSVGLAVSDDGGRTFRRAFEGPVLDRTPEEPYFTLSATVIEDGRQFRSWYTSGIGWVDTGAPTLEPLYGIRYAESHDGVHWHREGISCLPSQHDEESTASAAVVRQDGLYKMWFCYRGSRDFRDGTDAYRIGYAESFDGVTWTRDDALSGIAPGAAGEWDSLMQAYPAVIEVDGRLLMYYNGNNFGADGFGCAVLE